MQMNLRYNVIPVSIRSAVISLLVATTLVMGACSSTNDTAESEVQTVTENTLVRGLDFTPFDSALTSLDQRRILELDGLTRESNLGELRAQLASGSITARELTLFYISRIQTFDPSLHSVMELNPDALTEADRLDALQASGQNSGRLHGMPILLKDNIATGDQLHNTAGAAVLVDHRAPRDAFVISQLRAEGALILGKANLSEWAYFMSSIAPSGYSALGGQVVNPHGPALDVLGSSTGSAVAAAARFAAATIGTETTGSIIAPAAANGVTGMRPTLGLVSADLIVPISSAFDSAGPMARDVSSLAELLTVMGARDDSDANVTLAAGLHGTDFTQSLDSQSLSGLNIGIPSVAGFGADAPTIQLFETVIETLESAGASVVPVSISESSNQTLRNGQIIAFADSMATDMASYFRDASAPIESLGEVITFNDEALKTRAPFGQDLLVMARDTTTTPEMLQSLVEQLRTTASDAIRDGARINSVDVYLSVDNSFSLYYALAGMPAVTVPIGMDSIGQPHGATFVGIDHRTDASVLAIAHAFEQATQLRVEPVLTP